MNNSTQEMFCSCKFYDLMIDPTHDLDKWPALLKDLSNAQMYFAVYEQILK
jgi:hypothetical protein